jgi:hypothetical protein
MVGGRKLDCTTIVYMESVFVPIDVSQIILQKEIDMARIIDLVQKGVE